MLLGMDYLGGCKFEAAMLSAHRRGWSAGIFLRTFGDARKTLEAMARRGTFSEIVVHLAVFDRDHAYPVSQHLPKILADAKFCQSLQLKYPNSKLLLSPFCEHNHSAATMVPVFKKLQAAAPSCLMVNSIWKGAVVPGIITEIHLENAKPKAKPKGEYIVSFDGFGGDGSGDFADCDFDSIAARYQDARQIRGWSFRCNGKFSHNPKDKNGKPNDNALPPLQRKHWPTKEYLQGHLAVMEKREGALTFPKDALYKPFADDHGNPEPTKDNKAMLITKTDAQFIGVHDSKGNKIDTFRRVRPNFDGKGNMFGFPRYYSTKYASQILAQAKKNTGSNLIKVGDLPLTDGRKRSGQFR